MHPANIKIIFFAAVFAVFWGGYNIAKLSYVAIAWDVAEGTVLDFERHTWICGKTVSKCYTLIVGYYVNDNYYTVSSKENFDRYPPTHLLNEKIDVYYYPANPGEAELAGSYGAMNYGIILFFIGILVLLIFWWFRKKS